LIRIARIPISKAILSAELRGVPAIQLGDLLETRFSVFLIRFLIAIFSKALPSL
jgi:hypothetical protein